MYGVVVWLGFDIPKYNRLLHTVGHGHVAEDLMSESYVMLQAPHLSNESSPVSYMHVLYNCFTYYCVTVSRPTKDC